MVGLGVVLGAGLGGEGEGQLLAGRFSNDDLLLVNSVGGILELGNVEALPLNLILALDLGDLNGLGDADLGGGGVGELAGLQLGLSDEGNPVGLGLVFLPAVLVFSSSVSRGSISRGGAGCHLHGLRLLGVGDLCGGTVSDHVLPGVLVGAELAVHEAAGLLAHGEDPVEAVVIVDDLLDGKDDGGDLLREGGNAYLSVDGGVGIPAQIFRSGGVSAVGSCHGDGYGENEESLK